MKYKRHGNNNNNSNSSNNDNDNNSTNRSIIIIIIIPRSALIRIYKAFVRPYLDYGHILYNQAYNISFQNKLESIQYNVCLAITGAI